MKHSRRHELRTNELAESLTQLKEWFTVYGNYVIGGAAVVLLILGGGLYYSRSQATQMEQNWSEYRNIDREFAQIAAAMLRNPIIDPGQKEKLQACFPRMEALASTAGTEAVTCEAWRWIGEQRLLYATMLMDPSQINDNLDRAATAYQRAASSAPDRTFDVLAARFGLATVYEDKGQFDQARKIYHEIADNKDGEISVLRQLAADKLENFDRLTLPVALAAAPEIPTTRKAAASSAPATQKAAPQPVVKKPAAATKPASTKPAH